MRSMQLREEERVTNESASRAVDARAAQAKADQRAARDANRTERILNEQAAHAAAFQRRQEDWENLRITVSTEEQRRAKREETEAWQQRESELHAAILQKKEERRQALAAKVDEEESLSQRKRIQKEKREVEQRVEMEAPGREPLISEQKPVAVESLPAVQAETRTARSEASRRREEELRAVSTKQQRVELTQKRASERETTEAVAALRQDQRKELKRQVATQAQLESQAPVRHARLEESSAPALLEPEPSLREASLRQKPPAGPLLIPRAISRGRTSRAVVAGMATNTVTPSAEEVTPYVQTQGSFIVDENGDAVTLRGVTVRGLDTVAPQGGQTVPGALSLDASNLATITDQWGANLVRLPFPAGTILNGNGNLAASDLLAGLDLVVAAITGAGAYVLLALEAATGPADVSTLQVWQTLAERYQGEPRVFYEVFASSNAITGNLTTALATVIATIRQLDPTALIFVSGSADGLDVTNVPLRDSGGDPIRNLVYTIAVSVQSVPNPEVLSAVSAAYPIFASWSDEGSDLGRQVSRVADLFERCGIGWAAANWNNDPRLVTDAAGRDFTPTIWGNVVLRALKLTAPLLLEPADAPASLATMRAEVTKLSPLSTSGNFILDDSGQTIVLRGATVVGLDSATPGSGQTLADALSIDQNNLALMGGIWGLNLVRISFQAQTVLAGNGVLSAGTILAGLDLAATLISEAGAYVLLALDASPGTSLPDATTQQAWQILAKRYKNEPGVLYEIFATTEALAAGWSQAALSLVGTIRSQNSAAMIFVSTGNGGDLSGLPLLLPTGTPIYNVVYTVNVSPQSSPGPDDGPLASFADLYPVFVSTWSDDATNPSRVSPFIGDFFARHNIGFAAANWNADPRLVADAVNHDFTSTAWGFIAGRAATLPVRQMLKPF